MMGVVSGRCGNEEQALEYYRRAHEMNSRGLTAANVGAVYANQGNLDEAEAWLDSATVLEPNAPDWRSWNVTR